jgi:hypothetical protein
MGRLNGSDAESVLLGLGLAVTEVPIQLLGACAGIDDAAQLETAAASLVAMSLASKAQSRVSTLDMIRHFAAIQLSVQGKLQLYETRFIEFYQRFTANHGGQEPNIEALAQEFENIEAAMRYAANRKQWIAYADVLLPISRFLYVHGLYSVALDHWQALMASQVFAQSDKLRIRAARTFAQSGILYPYLSNGFGGLARAFLAESLPSFEATANTADLSLIHQRLGILTRDLYGEEALGSALEHLNRAFVYATRASAGHVPRLSTFTLSNSRERPGGLMIDVRGTIIDPLEDTPITQSLANSLASLLAVGFPVALNTATSLQSMQQLVLDPIRRRPQTTGARQRLVLYVDSGTSGHLLEPHGTVAPLPDFDDLAFTEIERKTILSVVDRATAERPQFVNHTKVKPGQVNFYSGGSWAERRVLADVLQAEFDRSGLSRVNVMVPTAKATIDIALCDKSRGTLDFERRHDIDGALIIIGDSLQERAPDLRMIESATHPVGIQVGPMAPVPGTAHLKGPGPDRVDEFLAELIAMLRSRESS